MTLTLHYAPNTVSLASIIVLEELGLSYRLERVDFASSQQRSAEHLRINPLGRVPVLATADGVLTETPALLGYLSDLKPDAGLMPSGAFARAQALSFASYLASTVHVAHAHRMRGSRWADDAEAIAAMQRKVPQSVLAAFLIIEQRHLDAAWVMGPAFTVCDAYLFTLAQWLEVDGVDVSKLPRVLDHRARVRARSATQRALAAERAGAPQKS